MSRKIETDPIEKADAERIGRQAELTVREADARRIEDARREALLSRLTGDLPEDPRALWLIAEHAMAQACVSMIEVGRALLKLKASLPHGEFEAGLAERGIPARTAQRLMLAARKFAGRSEKLLKLGRSKLYAIAEMLDDEQLDRLEAGDDVLGLTLDEAERMTAKELRDRLRKLETDLEIKDRLLEEAHKQRDDIATELERLKGGVPDSANDRGEALRAIEREKLDAIAGIMPLRRRTLDMERRESIDQAEWFAIRAAVEQLRDEVAMMLESVMSTGKEHQYALTLASIPSDAEVNLDAIPGAPEGLQ